ncbi:MAG: hypothetical protein IPI44_01580 [Sulfuritalea sp.]|nr:hypothetical protein [Sulfuritalea sp.]
MSWQKAQKVISYLPFSAQLKKTLSPIGSGCSEVSVAIITDNPLFGSYDFLLYLEELRQGQGIIDLVNSYLSIALSSGLVGLSLFACFFGVILWGIFKGMQGLGQDDERHLLGRVLMATLVGILVTIAAVSSINVIPFICWSVAGVRRGYIRLAARSAPSSVASAS